MGILLMNKGFIVFDIALMIVLTGTVSLLTLSSKSVDDRYAEIRLEYDEKERERVEEYKRIERCEECPIKDTF